MRLDWPDSLWYLLLLRLLLWGFTVVRSGSGMRGVRRISCTLRLNSRIYSVHLDWPLFTDDSLVHCRCAWRSWSFEIKHVTDLLPEWPYTLNALRGNVESFGARVSAVLSDIWQYDVLVVASCQGTTLINNAWSRYNHLRRLHGHRTTLWNSMLMGMRLNLGFWVQTAASTPVGRSTWRILSISKNSSQ